MVSTKKVSRRILLASENNVNWQLTDQLKAVAKEIREWLCGSKDRLYGSREWCVESGFRETFLQPSESNVWNQLRGQCFHKFWCGIRLCKAVAKEICGSWDPWEWLCGSRGPLWLYRMASMPLENGCRERFLLASESNVWH